MTDRKPELIVDEPICLSVYHPRWPELFRAEVTRLRAIVPAGSQLAFEHIGSTAVPGMVAKPIVDMMVGMEVETDDLARCRAALAKIGGYEDLGEAGVPGRIYLRRRLRGRGDGAEVDGIVGFNIALVKRGGSLWMANLALRDYLRGNDRARAEYEVVKRAAVESGAVGLLAYSEYKAAVVGTLAERATGKRGSDESVDGCRSR